MKKSILTLLAIVLIAGLAGNLQAQTSASESTNAGAVLIVAMTITETSPLHFGSVQLTGTTGGTVVLPSNSTNRTFTGDCAASTATPTATNAAYNVTGTALETYALTLPATTEVTHGTAGAGLRTMNITLMKARFSGAGADAVTSTLAANGTDSFTLGGTLTVGANQVAGVYSGSFNVSIDYN